MPGAPEAEHGRRGAERLRQIRERCDADAAADEQRPLDAEVEAVAERPRTELVAGLELAERARAGADRVDQEGELAGRRQAEAHRPRQHAAGRLEHEELPGRAAGSSSPLDAQQRVEPDRLEPVTLSRRSCRMAFLQARADFAAGVGDRLDRGRRAGERRDARDPRDQRRLADPVAVAARPGSLRRVDDEVAAPRRIRSTTVGSPAASDTFATDSTSIPAAASAAAVPLVARRRKPRPASVSATGTTASLSSSRTDRKAVPPSAAGGRRPAPPSRTRSGSRARTPSPRRSSASRGPSTGSLPGKRANGSTAAFTETGPRRGRPARRRGSTSSDTRAPAISRQAASTRLMPIALLANGTVREARGFASST